MHHTITVNAKLNNINEKNRIISFESNSNGLFNVSQLAVEFNAVRVATYGENPEMLDRANRLFIESGAELFDLRCYSGDYWATPETFHFFIKFHSPFYAESLNHYETLETKTRGDYWNLLTCKHTVVYDSLGEADSYRGYSIFMISALLRNTEQVKDFVTAHEITINKKANDRSSGNTEIYTTIITQCWNIVMEEVSELICLFNKYGAKLDFQHYVDFVRSTKARLDAAFPPMNEATPEKKPAKGSFFSKLLGG